MMELKGKKVLVVGLGKSGLAAALFLRRRGALVTVSDVRSAEALAKDIPALLDEGIMVEAGGHGLLTFRRQDLIVVSPGVPLNTPELAQVRSFGLPVIGELELAARFIKGRTLAITGSNGKTTTTALLGEILKEAGIPTLVGGNIGVPVVGLIDQSTDETWSVLEVSSFQLESTIQFHPSIAVILNITPDHLDRHGSFENYARAKERIFAAQDADDFVVLNADNMRAAEAATRSDAKVYWFSVEHSVPQGAWLEAGHLVYRPAPDVPAEDVMLLSGIPLKGTHNVENVLAALCAARLAGARTCGGHSQGDRELPGGRAPARVCGPGQRRRVLQRLQGHQCGRDGQSRSLLRFGHSPHPGRQRQRLRLSPALGAASGAGARRLHHRFRGSQDRVSIARRGHHPLLPDAGQCGQCSGLCRASRRGGAAGAGLLKLRPVRRLRASRPRLQATRRRTASMEDLKTWQNA
jgi:UDP-N-acetylmuramoylalanine--D-glutamate ligase